MDRVWRRVSVRQCAVRRKYVSLSPPSSSYQRMELRRYDVARDTACMPPIYVLRLFSRTFWFWLPRELPPLLPNSADLLLATTTTHVQTYLPLFGKVQTVRCWRVVVGRNAHQGEQKKQAEKRTFFFHTKFNHRRDHHDDDAASHLCCCCCCATKEEAATRRYLPPSNDCGIGASPVRGELWFLYQRGCTTIDI